MTKELYEGTPELIFYCEYNPNDFEDRLEIPFTDEYEITISKDKSNDSIIKIDVKPKKSEVPKHFFGQNIINVTAIAGKNGVGKTNVLKRILGDGIRLFAAFNIYITKVAEPIVIESFPNHGSRREKFFFTFKGISIDALNTTDIYRCCSKLYFGFKPRKIHNDAHLSLRANTSLFSMKSLYNLFNNNTFIQIFNFNYRYFGVRFPDLHDFLEMKEIDYIMSPLVNSNLEHKTTREKGVFYSKLSMYINLLCIIWNSREVDIKVEISKLINGIPRELLDDIGIMNYFNDEIAKILSVDDHEYKYAEILEKINIFFENKYLELGVVESQIFYGGMVGYLSFSRKYEDYLLLIDIIDLMKVNNESIFSMDFGQYSKGETSLFEYIASISEGISQFKTKSVFIFFDEYEQHLHPEWSRRYLSYLLKFLDAEGQRLDIKFQVILTTHSPYLISDLPKENIILLEKDEETGKRTARKSNYGFASNYYDIMSDSFFLDDTIGEFAKQKINQVIKRLNSLSNLLDKKEFRSKKVSNKFMQQSQLIFDHVNPIIQLIGDPFIKQQLDRMVMSINERLKVSCQPESKKELLEKQRAILEAQIKQIDQELGND